MKAIISEKGQVTVPKACRVRLGLKAGTELDFETEDGRLVATKIRHEDPIQRWRGRGSLPGHQSVDDYLRRIRE